MQRLQLEETVSNTLRGAVSKASFVPCSDPVCPYSISAIIAPEDMHIFTLTLHYCKHALSGLVLPRFYLAGIKYIFMIILS